MPGPHRTTEGALGADLSRRCVRHTSAVAVPGTEMQAEARAAQWDFTDQLSVSGHYQ